MEDRLYYNQPYLTEFTGVVREVRQNKKLFDVMLDRTAFYPTSGGQPFDTGTLNGLDVTDVCTDQSGNIWHTVNGYLSVGDRVEGKINWPRRFDHMQQHAGEHMIAGAIWRYFGGVTEGLHLGQTFSTIDVEMPGGQTHLTCDAIRLIEDDVNTSIQRDVPIRCWFPDEAELASLPLRKPPTVKEHVRVVAIGDNEMVACGGTHPSSAGQIALVKIIDVRPSRGKMRVAFVCGMRAVRDYQEKYSACEESASHLSVRSMELPQSVRLLTERITALEHELSLQRQKEALALVPALRSGAKHVNGMSVITAALDGLDMDGGRRLVTELISESHTVALIALKAENNCRVIFARGNGIACDMGLLLKTAAKENGGKGGGKSDYAQGSSPNVSILDVAVKLLVNEKEGIVQ